MSKINLNGALKMLKLLNGYNMSWTRNVYKLRSEKKLNKTKVDKQEKPVWTSKDALPNVSVILVQVYIWWCMPKLFLNIFSTLFSIYFSAITKTIERCYCLKRQLHILNMKKKKKMLQKIAQLWFLVVRHWKVYEIIDEIQDYIKEYLWKGKL